MQYKQNKRYKIAIIVVLILIIAFVYWGRKDKRFKDNQVVKTDQELLEVLKESEDKRLTFDKSMQVNDLKKQVIIPINARNKGVFERIGNGDYKSSIDTYYVNFQVIQIDDSEMRSMVLSSVDVFVDGKVNGISGYEDDVLKSQYTFKAKDIERVKLNVTFSYPEKFVKEFVDNFNEDKTNKKNNVVMKYSLNIGVDNLY